MRAGFEAEIAAAVQDAEDFCRATEIAESELEQLRPQVADMAGRLDEQRREVSRLHKETERLRAELGASQITVAQMHSAIAQSTAVRQDLENKLKEQADIARRALDEGSAISGRVAESEARAKASEQTAANLAIEKLEMQAVLSAREGAIAEAREEAADGRRDLAAAQERLAASERRVADLERREAALKDELSGQRPGGAFLQRKARFTKRGPGGRKPA